MIKKCIIAGLFLLWPLPAFAWNQTLTCYPGDCGEDESLPTYWESPCIAFHLNENGTNQIALSKVKTITRASIEAWRNPEISSLTPHLAGLTNEDRIGYNPYISENANIIVFRDNDSWTESAAMMALTTVTHRNSTGQIYDADIEINTSSYTFGIVEENGASVVDYQNTLTHEIGHVFGLAHSDDSKATMYPYSSTGETNLRTLESDDLEAIATIYPPSGNSCLFKDEYFEKPPYAMDEGPVSDDSCSSHPRHLGHHAPLCLFVLPVLYAIKRRFS